MVHKLNQRENARNLSWKYDPNGTTKGEQRAKGESVKCTLYSLPEHNQLFGRVLLEPGAKHGRVTAEKSCYYYVLSGRVDFYIYGDCGKCTTGHYDVVANEAIVVEGGTTFDYQASSDSSAEVMLFRNYA